MDDEKNNKPKDLRAKLGEALKNCGEDETKEQDLKLNKLEIQALIQKYDGGE